MKILQIIFASLLLCLFAVSFAYSQENSKKDKSNDKESISQSVEIKANLMVLEPDNTFADIKLEDIKIYEDGAEQKITRFEKKANVLNVGMVMDNTGSMKSQLSRVITAGTTFINNIRPQDEAFVVRFVNSDNVEILQDWTTHKKDLNSALEDLFIEAGKSAVIDAVYLAANKFQGERAGKSERNAIILITDGEDRDSYYKQKDLFDLLKTIDVQIFVIGLTGDLSNERNQTTQKKNSKTTSENFIKFLALKTGGAAYIAEGKDKEFETALVQSLKSILTELNSQYVIGYTSTNQKHAGLPRKLTVQVADGTNGAKRQAFIRDSFVVPEGKIK